MSDAKNGRRRPFVGREAEIAALLAVGADVDEPPVRVVRGPTGIGKTALLVELEARGSARGLRTRRIDLAREAPSTDQIEGAIAELVSQSDGRGRSLLLLDDIHTCLPLERWLAARLASGPTPLTVITDRRATSHVWHTGGAARVEEVVLGPLGPSEVDLFFDRTNVEPARRDPVRRFAQGHPLLLTLAATVSPWEDEGADARALLSMWPAFATTCDTPAKRSALALLVRAEEISYERLLHALGDEAATTATFTWLRELHWLDETPRGLVPHAVIRRAAAAYLETHHPALVETTAAAVSSYGRPRHADPTPNPLLTQEERPSSDDADDSWSSARPVRGAYFAPERTTAVMRLTRVAGWEDEAEDARLQAEPAAPAVVASPPVGSFRELLQSRLDELARQASLTEREREVFQLIVLGRNTNEIGMVLGITARTAKFHQQRILEKIGADGRADILRVLL